MSNYALVTIGIAAVLLTGSVPGGDGCGVATPTDHACCAEPAPERTSACCPSTSSPASPAEDEHGSRCDCIHPASTQAAMVASSSPPEPEKTQSAERNCDGPFSDLLCQRSVRATGHLRNHPPPPVFLLDCAFLI